MTAPVSQPQAPALELSGIDAGYGSVHVLRQVDLVVQPGQVVALLGANGAGKTTLLRTASGLLAPSHGQVRINGNDVTSQAPNRRGRAGLCLIPEGRGIFRNRTVAENLRMSTPSWVKRPDLDSVFETFPILKERRKQMAGTLSGGQQQMLALARATLSEAKLLLVDEVSMGLAPIVVDVIFGALQALADGGVALLLVEQYVNRALAMADSVYLIKKGEIRNAGAPSNLSSGNLMAEYMGTTAASAVPPTGA
jgi:branched-chain amino acid transport system ATP-binding protein